MKAISSLMIACAIAATAFTGGGRAQDSVAVSVFSIRSGETLPIRTYSYMRWANCENVFLEFEKFDILEGPPELSLRFEPGQVHASKETRDCPKPVKGGTILLTAKDIIEKKEAMLTFRVHIRTKDGQRQSTHRYNVLMFPAGEPTTVSK